MNKHSKARLLSAGGFTLVSLLFGVIAGLNYDLRLGFDNLAILFSGFCALSAVYSAASLLIFICELNIDYSD